MLSRGRQETADTGERIFIEKIRNGEQGRKEQTFHSLSRLNQRFFIGQVKIQTVPLGELDNR